MNGNRKKSLARVVIAVAAVAAAALIIMKASRKTEVDFYVLKPLDLTYTILAVCTVDYPKPLDLTFLQEGVVKSVGVSDGDRVVKGQELVRLDDFEAVRNLRISADNLKSAELKLENARNELLPNLNEKLREYQVNLDQAGLMLKRYRDLEAAGGVSRADLERVEKEYQAALSRYNQQKLELDNFSRSGLLAELENRVSVSRAQYELAQRTLENTRIVAPFDGTVIKVHVQTGQKAGASTRAVTVLETAPWQLVLKVDQKELPFLRPGLPALVTMDAYPDVRIEAEVSYVCTEVDKERNTCELRVELRQDVPFIKSGMAGKAEILAKKLEKAPALPARFLKKKGGDVYVWVWDGSKAVLTRVGASQVGERWVVVEGLAEGAVILDADITASASKLKPGRETSAPR